MADPRIKPPAIVAAIIDKRFMSNLFNFRSKQALNVLGGLIGLDAGAISENDFRTWPPA
jgi:hypothetical protein